MGYRRPARVFRLRFEDEPELEVMARSVPVGELLDIMKLADKMTGAPDEKSVKELFGWFAKRVIGWNLENEDGTPVPATLEGVLGQDFDFALKLVMAWVQAVSSVQVPLATTSAGSTASPDPVEGTIPMTPMASPAGTLLRRG